jgi:exodeoxyribonuclease VII large subunit
MERRRQHLDALLAHLNAIGPEQVLRRGYTITMVKKGGTVVRSANQVKTGEKLTTRFVDGTVESIVQDKRQMNLFENL